MCKVFTLKTLHFTQDLTPSSPTVLTLNHKEIKPLKNLHDGRSENYRPVVIGIIFLGRKNHLHLHLQSSKNHLLGEGDYTRYIPQCGDLLQFQAQVEEVCKDITQLT